jgi:hypothetical protein
MSNSKLKTGLLLFALACLAVLSAFQHSQFRHLTTENGDLRHQLDELGSLQSTNEHLAGRLSAALEMSQTNQIELARLRGQSVRLHQLEVENAHLKTQHQQLDRQLHQAQLRGSVPDQPQTIPVANVSVTPTPGSPRTVWNLGSLELSPGVPESFDIGGGTNCVVAPTALSDGNTATIITMSATNADGTVSEIAKSRIISRPGQQCAISVGDRTIALAVTLKAE